MLKSLPLRDIQIDDAFFASRIGMARDTAIPYMWEALNDRIPGVAPSGCIANFAIAAGEREGKFTGFVFQDSDLWKWIEGVAYSLATHPDAELESRADGAIALAGRAQQPDGYLDTFYIINGLEKRFTNLRDNHELYVAGHMFEAAAAYFAATGKRTILDMACRFADCIDSCFGPEEDKLHGYPGHEEVELGLARLYQATGEARYLKLAAYFLNARGTKPYYFDIEAEKRGEKNVQTWTGLVPNMYHQAHLPVREQKVGVGHSVRQGYLLAGMAEVGGLSGDETLVCAADTVYQNIVNRQMYVTGGVGATHQGEAFSFDYDLPPERCYTETCASISLIMTAARLNRLQPDGRYGDTVERALYNGILSGVSLDGTKYFYMNPLEVWPERCEKRQDMRVDDERQGWFGCACCPPNLLRTLTGLGQYICARDDDTLLIDQYIASTIKADFHGTETKIRMQANFPWNGRVTLTVEQSAAIRLLLRVPAWVREYAVRLNGAPITPAVENGYMVLNRAFAAGDEITLEFPMDVRFMMACGKSPNYAGKTALTRGPLVYCLEETDNGPQLWNLSVNAGAVETCMQPDLLGGVTVLTCDGVRESTGDALYSDEPASCAAARLTFVPYYAWGNRGKGEMSVWVRRNG